MFCTIGFSKQSERQIFFWDERDTSKSLSEVQIDIASGTLLPFFDSDTSLLYLAGPAPPPCSALCAWRVARGPWPLALGSWLLALGPWLLALGSWPLGLRVGGIGSVEDSRVEGLRVAGSRVQGPVPRVRFGVRGQGRETRTSGSTLSLSHTHTHTHALSLTLFSFFSHRNPASRSSLPPLSFLALARLACASLWPLSRSSPALLSSLLPPSEPLTRAELRSVSGEGPAAGRGVCAEARPGCAQLRDHSLPPPLPDPHRGLKPSSESTEGG
eukprot:209477-Rhodomonas_salina.1